MAGKNRIDIAGQRFARLLVLSYSHTDGKRSVWNCACDCGAKVKARGNSLRRGHAKSCGCLTKDIKSKLSTKHGLSRSPEYFIYGKLRQRCLNSKATGFEHYGGRGIENRYSDFHAFLQDVGKRPTPKHTLDRIDNNGHYEPGNCRWATRKAQSNNRRTCKFIEYRGITMTIEQWAPFAAVSRTTLDARLKSGWSIDRALSDPASGRWKHRNGKSADCFAKQSRAGARDLMDTAGTSGDEGHFSKVKADD